MQLLCLGLNHTTAPVSVRERVAFGPEQLAPGLAAILSSLGSGEKGGVREAMILSTCNRTEFYAAAEDTDLALESLKKLIEQIKGIASIHFEPHTYAYTQQEAARHIFRVVSGVDSMVLGETQIVGQFKKAVNAARKSRALGMMLNHVFEQAFSAAKLVRSSTAIGSSSVSLAAAAVRLSLRLFGDLKGENVLFVGAGEMIELCAAHFCAQSPKSVTVANRSIDRGEALATRYGGTAMRLQDLPARIAEFDVIVSCTASALPIIGLGMIERAIKERNRRPICIVDLAVPRDVEPEISRLDDVYVYSMDELGAVVQSGKESRKAAIVQAESLINQEVIQFAHWLAMRDSVPAIHSMRERAESIRRQIADEAKHKLAAGQDSDKVIDEITTALMHKLIHDPTVLLRNAEGLNTQERERFSTIVARFFRNRGA